MPHPINSETASSRQKLLASIKSPAFPDLFDARGETATLTGTVKAKPGATDQSLAEALMAKMRVDPNVWGIDRMKIGRHEMGYKKDVVTQLLGKERRRSSEAGVQPLYSIQVWLKRKTQELKIRDTFADMLSAFKTVRLKVKHVPSPKTGLLLEADIFDPHFGKLCWEPETESPYDLQIASTLYAEAREGLLMRAKGFPVERILFPVGNDVFHVDNGRNTTTKGTPLDVAARWKASFIAGRKAMVETILRFREIAPVDVVMIPSNHDEEAVFYLGEVLRGIFNGKVKGVHVDDSQTSRKYYRYGQNLIGFTHGNMEKHADLPLIMAQERKKDWAETKFREIHCGHFHHLKTISFTPVREFNTIRVRTLASLTPPDLWHKKMGYEGLRSANAHVWDFEEGLVASLSYQVK